MNNNNIHDAPISHSNLFDILQPYQQGGGSGLLSAPTSSNLSHLFPHNASYDNFSQQTPMPSSASFMSQNNALFYPSTSFTTTIPRKISRQQQQQLIGAGDGQQTPGSAMVPGASNNIIKQQQQQQQPTSAPTESLFYHPQHFFNLYLVNPLTTGLMFYIINNVYQPTFEEIQIFNFYTKCYNNLNKYYQLTIILLSILKRLDYQIVGYFIQNLNCPHSSGSGNGDDDDDNHFENNNEEHDKFSPTTTTTTSTTPTSIPSETRGLQQIFDMLDYELGLTYLTEIHPGECITTTNNNKNNNNNNNNQPINIILDFIFGCDLQDDYDEIVEMIQTAYKRRYGQDWVYSPQF